MFQPLNGNCTIQDKAVSGMPVTLPRISPFPRLVFINTQFDEIAPASPVELPEFPNYHAQASAIPSVYLNE